MNGKKLKRVGIGIFILLGLADIAAAAVGDSTGSTPIAPSPLVDTELGRIYDKSETDKIDAKTSVAPWGEANKLMQAVRNLELGFGINSLNSSLFYQGMGTSTPQDKLFLDYFSGYCAKSSTNEASNKNFTCQSDASLQHATINGGILFQNYVHTTPEQQKAAQLAAQNIVDPFPSADMSDPAALSKDKVDNPQNRKIIAEALADQAVLSTARAALASTLAKRQPIDGIDGNRSFMEILEKEATKDFLNDAWQERMRRNIQGAISAGKPELALQYENAVRDAYTTFLLYRMYREQEESKVLLAALLAVMERQAKAGANVIKTATPQSTASGQ